MNITVEGELTGEKVLPDFPVLAETKGPNPIEFENGYVAFEDLPDRQRHLPGEAEDDDLEPTGNNRFRNDGDEEIE